MGQLPILFVVNKIDQFDIDVEDLSAAIGRQKEYLKTKGFLDPVVCPVSARAGYLSKRSMEEELSRAESRKLYHFVDKFSEMGLPAYYERVLPGIRVADVLGEEEQLQRTCGLAYVERLIMEGGAGEWQRFS